MFIGLSFIGKLPKYIIECIHQIRCYYNDNIYLILDDYNSPYLNDINKFNITLIKYQDVIDENFNKIAYKNYNKFLIVNDLNDRKLLFIRAFERFFLINNLMKNNNLNDCLFIELDNLIYDNPINWINEFSKFDLCYMFDRKDHFSSGIIYIKNTNSLSGFLDYMINFIENSNEFMSEMTCLSRYYENNKNKIQLLPIYWEDKSISNEAYMNYGIYGESIFDAAAIGIYLLGEDPIHNNGKVVCGKKHVHSEIDYTKNNIIWKKVNNLKKPYIVNGEKLILINNLHVHSKELQNGLSIPL